jgi:hypothetical protein
MLLSSVLYEIPPTRILSDIRAAVYVTHVRIAACRRAPTRWAGAVTLSIALAQAFFQAGNPE